MTAWLREVLERQQKWVKKIGNLCLLLTFGRGGSFIETVAVETACCHLRSSGAVVAAGLDVDSLALVASVVDTLVSAKLLELRVDERGPPFPRPLHPLASVERPALRGPASGRIAAVGTAKPSLPRAFDSVVLPLRNHHVRMGVVLLAGAIQAGMDRHLKKAIDRGFEDADVGRVVVLEGDAQIDRFFKRL